MCLFSVLGCVCAVSWATRLLLSGVPARCVCRVCRVLGHLAPVHRCACLVCCVAVRCPGPLGSCSPGVLAPCVVLRAQCPGPLGSCSLVCLLGPLCGVRGVLDLLAPVHRCALWVCCAACVGLCCGAGTSPSGQRPYVAGRGWVRCRARTHPSGRRLFRSQQGLGSLPGAHTFIRTAAGVVWHLFACRGLLRVVRAVRVCGTRWPLLLGTRLCALVVARGVPPWRAPWPHVVRRALSGPVALSAPVGFPDAVVPFPTQGACAPGFTGRLRGVRGDQPSTGLIVPAAGPYRGKGAGPPPCRTRSGPHDGVVPGRVPPASVLGCACCGGLRVWTRSLTHPVSRTVRLSAGEWAGAPGLFHVDANSPTLGLVDAKPGSRACVRSGVALFLSFCWRPPPSPPLFLCDPGVSGFLWFPAPGVLGLGAPCPPPPRPPPRGGQSGSVPYGPPGLTGQQRRTRNHPRQVPGQGSALRALGPLRLPTAPQAVGVWDSASTAAPPVPFGSQEARVPPSCAQRTPVPVHSQSWDGQVVCPCDMEVARPWPNTPRWAQRKAPLASPAGLEHQATLTPHTRGPAPQPSPRTPTRAHTRTHAHACTHPDG